MTHTYFQKKVSDIVARFPYLTLEITIIDLINHFSCIENRIEPNIQFLRERGKMSKENLFIE